MIEKLKRLIELDEKGIKYDEIGTESLQIMDEIYDDLRNYLSQNYLRELLKLDDDPIYKTAIEIHIEETHIDDDKYGIPKNFGIECSLWGNDWDESVYFSLSLDEINKALEDIELMKGKKIIKENTEDINLNNKCTMEKDLRISTSIEKIDELIKNFENNKPKGELKTNCKWGEKQNLNTLDQKGLISVLVDINTILESYKKTKDEVKKEVGIELTDTFEIYGFTLDDWKNDVLFLLRKKNWTEKLKSLKESKEKLESYYSPEKKDSIAIDKILNRLGI